MFGKMGHAIDQLLITLRLVVSTFRQLVVEPFDLSGHLMDMGEGQLCLFPYGVMINELHLLGQVADGHLLWDADATTCG